jgi:hypothetical protein
MKNLASTLDECKLKRAEAIESLRVLNIGPQWFRAGEDVTKVETARAKRIVEEMDALMAGYKQTNAY